MKKEYILYELEDLLDNQEFVNWVKGLSEADIRNHYAAEVQDLETIISAKKILEAAQSPVHHNLNQDKIWDQIASATTPAKDKGRVISLFPKLAAMAAVLIGGWLIFTQVIDRTLTVSSGFGEIKEVTLPDGSTVSLNADTEVEYEKDFKTRREIRLSGEAFFQVQKGSKFTVVTQNGNVEVLGTSFNVMARSKKLEVYCKTGKVLVYNKSLNKESVLLPGQGVVFDNKEWTEHNTTQNITWQRGSQHYEKISLSKAADILQTFYGVPVVLPNQSDTLLFTGQISFEKLEKSIEEITWPFRLQYKVEKDTVYIRTN